MGAAHKYNHRRTWKEFGKRIDPHAHRWPGKKQGKYWKGQLAKARRQLDKSIIAYEMGWIDRPRYRSFLGVSGECNWKTW